MMLGPTWDVGELYTLRNPRVWKESRRKVPNIKARLTQTDEGKLLQRFPSTRGGLGEQLATFPILVLAIPWNDFVGSAYVSWGRELNQTRLRSFVSSCKSDRVKTFNTYGMDNLAY